MPKSIWTLVVSKGAHWQFREITPCKCLCFNWTVSSTRLWLLSIHLFTFTAAPILQRKGFCQAPRRCFIFILCTFVHNRFYRAEHQPGSPASTGQTCLNHTGMREVKLDKIGKIQWGIPPSATYCCSYTFSGTKNNSKQEKQKINAQERKRREKLPQELREMQF